MSTREDMMDDPDTPLTLSAQRTGFDVIDEVEDLRDKGEVRRAVAPFSQEATLFTRYADMRAVHGDGSLFRIDAVPMPPSLRAQGIGEDEFALRRAGNLLALDPPDHTRLRRMLTAEFTVKRMKRLQPRVVEIVEEHLDAMEAAGSADLVEDFALPVPSMVICELLGVPYADRAEFSARSARQLDGTIPVVERLRLGEEARDYMAELVSRHRRAPGEDLLGMLIREHSSGSSDSSDSGEGGEITDAELIGIANLLLIAGHETTSNMLSLGTLALLRHPDQLARVRDEPDAVDAAVEELLRYLSVVHGGFPRAATQDTVVGGVPVAAGEVVMTSIPAANRDPELVADGDVLDISRRPTPHLAFGHGIHHCLGAPLARIEMRIAFPALFRRFPGLRLAVDDADVDFRHRTLIYGLRSLPVAW